MMIIVITFVVESKHHEMSRSMGSHQSTKMKNNEWLTPPSITEALGPFDLDPCSPINRPWSTADKHLTVEDNGLLHPWHGLVWCNPPYGHSAADWLERCAIHNNCIALIFARTETKMWFDFIWDHAKSILFIEGRLTFHYVDGTAAKANGGAPSALIAYGNLAHERLETSGIPGKLIEL